MKYTVPFFTIWLLYVEMQEKETGKDDISVVLEAYQTAFLLGQPLALIPKHSERKHYIYKQNTVQLLSLHHTIITQSNTNTAPLTLSSQ